MVQSHFVERWSRLAELDAPEATRKIFNDKKRQCLVCETQEVRQVLGPGGPGLTLHNYADGCARCSSCMLADFKLLYETNAPEDAMLAYFEFMSECMPCMWRHLKRGLDAHGISGPVPQDGFEVAEDK